ncbi:MAG TPA: hypothetical protein PLQ52_11865, partial [Lacunisphaera sp.]|nr:hypothetical protein [Lacunisphaera sp.]
AGLLLLVVGAAALTLAWYARNLGALREFVAFAAQDSSSLIYGQRPAFWTKWGFWLPAVHREFFNPLVGFALLPLAAAFALPALRRRLEPRPPAGGMLAGAGLLQVLLVLWGFSLQIPEITRYSLPLLVSALLPLVWLLSLGPRRWLAPAALALIAGQWLWSHGTALGLLPVAPRGSEWLVRADPDPSYGQELDALIAQTTTPATAYRYQVNGYELPWLNANTLSFHAAKQRLRTGIRAYYTSLGYGATDPVAAYRRVIDMQADTFISLDTAWHEPKPAFMNQTALAVLEQIRANPDFVPETFYNQHHIVLYRRNPKPH